MNHKQYQQKRDGILEDLPNAWCEDCLHPRCIRKKRTVATQIDNLIVELIGEDAVQDWDADESYCENCGFTLLDDSKNCVCVQQNEVRANLRNIVKGDK